MEHDFLTENIIRFYKSGYAVPTFWFIFLAVYLLMLGTDIHIYTGKS